MYMATTSSVAIPPSTQTAPVRSPARRVQIRFTELVRRADEHCTHGADPAANLVWRLELDERWRTNTLIMSPAPSSDRARRESE